MHASLTVSRRFIEVSQRFQCRIYALLRNPSFWTCVKKWRSVDRFVWASRAPSYCKNDTLKSPDAHQRTQIAQWNSPTNSCPRIKSSVTTVICLQNIQYGRIWAVLPAAERTQCARSVLALWPMRCWPMIFFVPIRLCHRLTECAQSSKYKQKSTSNFSFSAAPTELYSIIDVASEYFSLCLCSRSMEENR